MSVKSRLRLLFCLFIVFFFSLCRFSAQTLRIYHIDVEQGASTLLLSPSGKTLLIDSGKTGHGARIKSVMNTAGVSRIDFFVDTHYHEDHYGGIDELARDPAITIGKAYDRGDKDELDSTKLSESAYQTMTQRSGIMPNNLLVAKPFRSIRQ